MAFNPSSYGQDIPAHRAPRAASLSEVHSSIFIPHEAGFWRKLGAFTGPGLMVAVGYMDPGNWATDLAGGAKFGYTLLSVILFSNLIAILLQHLSLRLGIVTGLDLAQACRAYYSRPVSFLLWILCEIAICACDLAEIIGSAIALNLLFGLPLIVGVVLTSLDVLIILMLQQRGFRVIESIVGGLIAIIGMCFLYELIIAQPNMKAVLGGFIPTTQIVFNPEMLYVSIGILGATVMPHNLYLHSSIVQTRAFKRDDDGIKMALKFATIDSTVALSAAFFINAAILIVSAAAFHGTANSNVADINDAYVLLSPALGAAAAGIVFAIALLAAGQNSTLTGTMAGQIVLEGFLNVRLRPWVRRLISRLLAIGPAAFVAIYYGEKGLGTLLVFSQVVLSFQLAFAVVPLVSFVCSPQKMGHFVVGRYTKILSWLIAVVIVTLNLYLLWSWLSWRGKAHNV